MKQLLHTKLVKPPYAFFRKFGNQPDTQNKIIDF